MPVLGNIKNLEFTLDKLQFDKKPPQKIVIATNRLKGTEISNIMRLVDSRGMTIGRAPMPNELIEGNNVNSQVKDISIEDLLGRRQNKLEHGRVKSFN